MAPKSKGQGESLVQDLDRSAADSMLADAQRQLAEVRVKELRLAQRRLELERIIGEIEKIKESGRPEEFLRPGGFLGKLKASCADGTKSAKPSPIVRSNAFFAPHPRHVLTLFATCFLIAKNGTPPKLETRVNCRKQIVGRRLIANFGALFALRPVSRSVSFRRASLSHPSPKLRYH